MAKTATSPGPKKPASKAPPKAPEAPRPSLKPVEFTAGKPDEAIRAAEATSKKIYMVPLPHLHVAPGYNVRVVEDPEYKRRMLELRDSIISHGFYNTKPLAGFVGKLPGTDKDVIFITDGHRRLEAAKMAIASGAELERLPIILKPANTTTEDLTDALFEENDQQNLSGMERAILAKRLIALGKTKEEVAVKLRVGIRMVENYLGLIAAPKSVRELVTNGVVSSTEAMRVLRTDQTPGKKDAEAKLLAIAGKVKAKNDANPDGKKSKITQSKVAAEDSGVDNTSVKMETITIRSAGAAGTTMAYEDIFRFKDLFEDSDWYSLTDRDGVIEINEPFEIVVRLRRPKKSKVEEVEASPPDEPGDEIEEPAPKKRGRPKKPDVPVGVEVDPLTMEGVEEGEDGEEPDDDDDDEVPNLRELGIADDGAADL